MEVDNWGVHGPDSKILFNFVLGLFCVGVGGWVGEKKLRMVVDDNKIIFKKK